MSDPAAFEATGRRKTAVARVRLSPGSGRILVNRRSFENFFPSESLRTYILQPLNLTDTQAKYDVTCRVCGGGNSGQAGAVRHGIARALTNSDASLREVLKGSGCLTRDPRMRERKKPGQPGARRRFQFSKR